MKFTKILVCIAVGYACAVGSAQAGLTQSCQSVIGQFEIVPNTYNYNTNLACAGGTSSFIWNGPVIEDSGESFFTVAKATLAGNLITLDLNTGAENPFEVTKPPIAGTPGIPGIFNNGYWYLTLDPTKKFANISETSDTFDDSGVAGYPSVYGGASFVELTNSDRTAKFKINAAYYELVTDYQATYRFDITEAGSQGTVPEPSSMLLMAGALGMLALVRRRRIG